MPSREGISVESGIRKNGRSGVIENKLKRGTAWILGAMLLIAVSPASAAGGDGPALLGIPVDFILFGLTLLGVALFHHYTLQVALTGLATITLYKLVVTGFKTGDGLAGLAAHIGHEWVLLANLLGLLLGFALLSRHFEESRVPEALPRYLPDDWKGGFVLLVMIFVLSSFLDNIAAALIGGTMARIVFRHKVHIGYLAAIVAASNAGGSGSVVGDTTTTMMWIDGVAPLNVFHAYAAASVALVVFGIPAARQQQRYSPIVTDAPVGIHIDWTRVGIVAFILLLAIVANVTVNREVPGSLGGDSLPWHGGLGGTARHGCHPQARMEPATGCLQGCSVPAVAGDLRLDDAGGKAAPGFVANGAGAGFRLCGVRQHSAHRAGAQAGRLRLGLPRLRGRLRWLDDLVRLFRRRGGFQPFPRSQVRRPLAAPRLARGDCLRGGLFRDAGASGLAAARAAQGSAGGCAGGRATRALIDDLQVCRRNRFGDTAMLKALLPVDGSENALRAVRHLIALVQGREPMEVFLLNVQEPIDAWEVRRCFKPEEIEAMQEVQGGDALKAARELLEQAGVPFTAEVLIGDLAPSIAGYAKSMGCDKIIMGTRGMTPLANLLMGSVATKVIHLADVPVTLVK